MQRGSFHPHAGCAAPSGPPSTQPVSRSTLRHEESHRLWLPNRSAVITNHRGRGRNQGQMSEQALERTRVAPRSRANHQHIVRGRDSCSGRLRDCCYEIPGHRPGILVRPDSPRSGGLRSSATTPTGGLYRPGGSAVRAVCGNAGSQGHDPWCGEAEARHRAGPARDDGMGRDRGRESELFPPNGVRHPLSVIQRGRRAIDAIAPASGRRSDSDCRAWSPPRSVESRPVRDPGVRPIPHPGTRVIPGRGPLPLRVSWR